MKNYVILLLTTIFLISVMEIGSFYFRNAIFNVDAIDVMTSSVQNTIVCSGVVEYAHSESVICKSSAIINDIFVKKGDYVKKGDNLLEATNIRMNEKPLKDTVFSNIDNIGGSLNELNKIKEMYSNILSNSESKSQDYKENGDPYNIKAPMSGLISSVNTAKNNIIKENFNMLTISDTNEMQIRLYVNESQISDIKVGQNVLITGVGFKNSEYRGKVYKISDEAEKIVGPAGKETVVNVIVKLDDVNDDLKPGYTAKCKIITSQKDNLILTPYESVQYDDNGKEFVYRYENGRSIKTYIETGNEYPEGYEVLSGISSGDTIIKKQDNLHNNDRVKINKN